MRLETHTTERKLVAQAIGEWIHEPVHYDGMPSCAYSIGPVKVERGGVITSDDADVWNALIPFFRNHGWLPEEEPIQERGETPRYDAERLRELAEYINRVDIDFPADEVTPDQIKNFCRIMYSKQALLNLAYGQDIVYILPEDLEKIEAENTVEGIEQVMQTAFEDSRLDGFRFRSGSFVMTFPQAATDHDTWNLYLEFMKGVVHSAMTAKRIKKEATIPEGNSKYLMHTWLMRMGFGGLDFKALRKLLLDRLEGFCAFPDTARADKFKARYAEMRRIKHEVNEEAGNR